MKVELVTVTNFSIQTATVAVKTVFKIPHRAGNPNGLGSVPDDA